MLLLAFLMLTVESFRDDFTGTELNRSAWGVEVGCDGNGNSEAQCYVDDPLNLFVSNGSLHIVARRAADGKITSGRINTLGKMEQVYGRWEARVQVPAVLGTWPAFWTLGADLGEVGWPSCGEIDIMENFQRGDATSDSFYSTAHSVAHSWGTNTALPGGFSTPLDHSTYHTVRLDWREESLTFYVDGVQTWALERAADASNFDWPYDKPHFAILNLAIGGNGVQFQQPPPAAYPLTYRVDYVSVVPLPPLPPAPFAPPAAPPPPTPPPLQPATADKFYGPCTKDNDEGWIDVDSLASVCTTTSSVDPEEFHLVFSDEFNRDGRTFKVLRMPPPTSAYMHSISSDAPRACGVAECGCTTHGRCDEVPTAGRTARMHDGRRCTVHLSPTRRLISTMSRLRTPLMAC